MSANLPDGAGRVTVLGDGGWGTALAVTLARKGLDVTVWGAFPEYVEEVRRTRVNRKFLDGIDLPEALALEADAAKATEGAELVVVAIPTKFMRATLERIGPALPRDVPYVTVAKGLEEGRLARGTEIIHDCLGDVGIACLAGPSHAEEVAKRLPAAVVAAAETEDLARLVQTTFLTATFRVYRCTDLVGVELGGAVKNVIAIAAGICDGLEFGDNSKAALLTRGLAEMTRLGVRMGADAATFRGLSGIGDLITTCCSPFGRNRAVGVKLGQGVSIKEIEASTEMVAEGVKTAPAICDLAEKMKVEMPIAREVCAVLLEGKAPKQAVVDLMTRPPKAESESFESSSG